MNIQELSETIGAFRIDVILDESSAEPLVRCEFYSPVTSSTILETFELSNRNKVAKVGLTEEQNYINGEITLDADVEGSYECVTLLCDFEYGGENNSTPFHRTGSLAVFKPYVVSSGGPTPPPPPGPCPFPDGIIEGSVERVMVESKYENLFPYLDLYAWPESVENDIDYIDLYQEAPAPDTLYGALVNDFPHAATMMANSKVFLEGDSDYTNTNYNALNDVPYPLNLFPLIYDEIHSKEAFSIQEVVEVFVNLMIAMANLESITALIKDVEVMDYVGQNYMALSITQGYKRELEIDFYKILIVCHFIEYLIINEISEIVEEKGIFNREIFKRLMCATIILPKNVFPIPNAAIETSDDTIVLYASGELQMTKYKHTGYSTGEIAHIENLMPGETKTLQTRELNRTVESEERNDQKEEHGEETGKTGSVSLIDEVSKTVSEFSQAFAYVDFKTTYGAPSTLDYSGSYTITDQPPEKDIEDKNRFVKNIIGKTLSKLKKNVAIHRKTHNEHELEEKSMRILDNSNGGRSVRGVYRWLNKNYEIRVDSYGYRLLVEFNLKDPAKEYLESQSVLNGVNLDFKSSLPDYVGRSKKGICSYVDITRRNFNELIEYYDVREILLPPEEFAYVFASITSENEAVVIAIPEGYQAIEATVSALCIPSGSENTIDISIAGINATIKSGVNPSDPTPPIVFDNSLSKQSKTIESLEDSIKKEVLTNSIPFAITNDIPLDSIPSVNTLINAKVKCRLTETALNEWKIAVYSSLLQSYEIWLGKYNQNLTRLAEKHEGTNDQLVRNIERSMLRDRIEELLFNLNLIGTLDEEVANVNKPAYDQFFNASIEWNEMNFSFDNSRPNLSYAQQGKDDSLRSFLQANEARVILPIAPEFNQQFVNYLSSGVIWTVAPPFVPAFSDDMDVVNHFKEKVDCNLLEIEGEKWTVQVPTFMKVIDDSISF